MSISCANYGLANSTACACPPGFGGSSCAEVFCGGTIFQGSSRSVAPTSGPYSNVTSCSCDDGWTGTGCNVCQTASACQAGLSSSGAAQNPLSGLTGLQDQNNTLTCNIAPRVYAASEMSCQVLNPTLQAVYPQSSTLNILRTLNPSLTSLPNATGFGSAGSVYAQLFYAGVEQFYCTADSCTQTLTNESSSSTDSTWTCQNLQCTCINGTSMCGAVTISDLTEIIDGLTGELTIDCDSSDPQNHTVSCAFKQRTIQSVFGSRGLSLSGCVFGECVSQSVIDTLSSNGTTSDTAGGSGKELSGGVIAGLAVVGALLCIAKILLICGWIRQRRARRAPKDTSSNAGGVGVSWSDVSYFVPSNAGTSWMPKRGRDLNEDKVVLDAVSGCVPAGQMLAVMGPSGAGKTTLIEILASKQKSGHITGSVAYLSSLSTAPRIGFVPQQDVLPAMLTVREALLFAARLRLPENVPEVEKRARVDGVLTKLGIAHITDMRIGSGERRGISGGEMRRVSIGLELVARPDVLILDEPTSGLDSVSAAKVASVLRALAHDEETPTAVVASIHQPSSQLYQTFDQVLVLAHGRTIYSGRGGLAPAEYFSARGISYKEGYNVADFLLDVASDPPVTLFQTSDNSRTRSCEEEKAGSDEVNTLADTEKGHGRAQMASSARKRWTFPRTKYATTFLTQLEVLSGREWKVLRRDHTLFFAHIAVACVLGVFCGGIYYKTGITIAGFQSRVGCLFFLGALIAFSSLSALFNVVEVRPLFLRERSAAYYSPSAWLLSRVIFDVIPLRVIPTIIVGTITYWMGGLAHDAAHFFKFLLVLVLYTLAMTLLNFLLACVFRNGGIAILISALLALYQMTYAGFFVHLTNIPPVLRWLQWLCPLKYMLEALSVNEVGSRLEIEDSLAGVPVQVSASLIMETLFGFGQSNYYRDVLVLFAFIAGFGMGVIGAVWLRVRERR